MRTMKVGVFLAVFILSFSLVYGDVQVGNNPDDSSSVVIVDPSSLTPQFSNVTFNQSLIDSLYLRLSGSNANQNVDITQSGVDYNFSAGYLNSSGGATITGNSFFFDAVGSGIGIVPNSTNGHIIVGSPLSIISLLTLNFTASNSMRIGAPSVYFSGNDVSPATDNGNQLGTSTFRWSNVHAINMNVSNNLTLNGGNQQEGIIFPPNITISADGFNLYFRNMLNTIYDSHISFNIANTYDWGSFLVPGRSAYFGTSVSTPLLTSPSVILNIDVPLNGSDANFTNLTVTNAVRVNGQSHFNSSVNISHGLNKPLIILAWQQLFGSTETSRPQIRFVGEQDGVTQGYIQYDDTASAVGVLKIDSASTIELEANSGGGELVLDVGAMGLPDGKNFSWGTSGGSSDFDWQGVFQFVNSGNQGNFTYFSNWDDTGPLPPASRSGTKRIVWNPTFAPTEYWWYTQPGVSLYVDGSTGYIGITNNTNPQAPLHVAGIGTGDVLSDEYDAMFGSSDYGAVEIGDLEVFMTDLSVGGLDLNGTAIWRNEFNTTGGQAPEIEFAWATSDNLLRFAIPKAGVDFATYNPRSMMVGGDLGQSFASGLINCTAQGYDELACDTGTYGADLGVQNDLQVRGSVYGDCIESMYEISFNDNGAMLSNNYMTLDGGIDMDADYGRVITINSTIEEFFWATDSALSCTSPINMSIYVDGIPIQTYINTTDGVRDYSTTLRLPYMINKSQEVHLFSQAFTCATGADDATAVLRMKVRCD